MHGPHGGLHDGAVEGAVALEAHGAGVVAEELADVGDQGLDAGDVAAQDDLVLAVDVGNEHLVDGRAVLGALRLAAGAAIADELVDGADQRLHVLGLADDGHHAVLAAVLGLGGARGGGHGVGALLHHVQAVLELDVAARHEGGELAERVAQGEVGALRRPEAELALEDAQDHDGRGHDGGLGDGRQVELLAGPLVYHPGQLVSHDVVDLLDDGFGRGGEGFYPGREHAHLLDPLPCYDGWC